MYRSVALVAHPIPPEIIGNAIKNLITAAFRVSAHSVLAD